MERKIKAGEQMAAYITEADSVIDKIMENALKTRPEVQVTYRPYIASEIIKYTDILSWQQAELSELFPNADDGDYAFVDFCVSCEHDEEVYLNVMGNIKVFYNGDIIHDNMATDSGVAYHLPIRVRKDEKNFVRICCIKRNGEFSFKFLLSIKRYPEMWANDYLFRMRAVMPVAEYCGEDGAAISVCYSKSVLIEDAMRGEIEYILPQKPCADAEFDFEKLCCGGDVCYVYTEAESSGKIEYRGTVEAVFVNGESVVPNGEKEIYANAGDKLLFKCRKKDNWCLRIEGDVRLPWLTSARGTGDKAIFVGPFYGEKIHAPEFCWDFKSIFTNEQGEKLYWKFCDGSELRIYLDSIFFGQWFYALMVGFYGIRSAAAYLGDYKKQQLFCRNMKFLAEYFDYVRFDIEKHTMPAFMPRVGILDALDNIGTMGMNIVDAYFDSNDKVLVPLIDILTDKIQNAIPRMKDKTYFRNETMWADDLYMSCPFLVRLGRLSGEKVWYERAASQIQGFSKRLFMPEEGLFSHIFFVEQNQANRVPWGRGNGWVMWTLSELLIYAEGKIDLTEYKELFCKMANSIKGLQDKSGLWRQVLSRNDDESYLETSCSAMFLLAFARGVKYGWLDESFIETMDLAYQGLLNYSIDCYGNVYGVCMGSGCAMEAEYYFDIPTAVNDDHGTGVVLAALSEYSALKKMK